MIPSKKGETLPQIYSTVADCQRVDLNWRKLSHQCDTIQGIPKFAFTALGEIREGFAGD
ncbi:MAG TPA: hypothetical protein PKD64_00875 [Pirellulaceae bacterium]|nr:hypothetical protein [Pirellulaceae bacterium]HMO90723.1 hypothetical protein [Pirellulaceae bacterium]HMP67974.1 hypothetical protein [Pirellulaceae bacterium]